MPPAEGDYFAGLHDFIERQNPGMKSGGTKRLVDEWNKSDDQLDLAWSRPWSMDELPALAAWLAANKKPLDIAVEASGRTKFFDPIRVSGDGLLLYAWMPLGPAHRTIAEALVARATLQLHDHKTDAAWQDLLAVHRLGRLTGQGPTLVHALVALDTDRRACNGDLA